ncbi:hypothetical protein MRS76_23110 [Rhizobiaceae bacterium n13]|uniref:Uncharacterized protein n=1 Tax=Ferirhizobium litorale TaxID=2927786 RepID=A0AAE3QD29_9HYPH|nr:hypothetical protein [Fererhizobium litorale]MDI7864822.1 hypothetical protein [Fererhizobium litorale]MDI7921735.1 hypothetical protein [Fererhizobium litorale]
MAASGNRHLVWAIWFLLALCAALLAWMSLRIDPEFERLTRVHMLDFRFSGYEPDAVRGLSAVLANNDMEQARTLLRFNYSGPDLILPLAATLLGVLVIARFAPGTVIFGRTVTPRVARLLCLLPITYGIADYAENFFILFYFPPAEPGPWLSENAPQLLPWITRTKLALATVSAILMVRFTLLRYTAPAGTHGPG